MTQTKTSPFASAPREIDTASLDQVVGGAASIVMHDARKQEQGDKLTAEQSKK